MKTTIVAVTNSYNDTVTMLPPSAYIDGIGHVTFHNNPRLEFDGEMNVTNFGYHIDFRITKNKLHAELMGNMYHHYPRLKRRTQYLNVFKFNQDRSIESQITIPHYYMATLREGEHVGITNFGIPKCDKVVIKEQLGARGSNQVVVPTNMLTTLLKHSKGKTLGEVKDMFPDLIYTDNSNWDMLFFDNPNDLFVSELISNIKSEYRLLVGGDKIYGRERTIKAGPYPQANLDTDKFHTVQEVNYEPIEDMFDESLVETLYAFAEYIDLPIGSIDLYSTTDGKWGIFEYSTQFAFHGANPNFIKQLLLDGVKQVLLRNQKPTPKRQIVVNLSPNDPSPKTTLSHMLRNHEHTGVTSNKEALRGINAGMRKPEGMSCGESRVIIGEVDEYRSLLNDKLTAAKIDTEVNDLLVELLAVYPTFISTFEKYSTIPRLLNTDPRRFEIKGVRLVDGADNGWMYEIDAGYMSLKISGEPQVSMILEKQGFELFDFISVNSNILQGDGVSRLTEIAIKIRTITCAIARLQRSKYVERNEPITRTKPRMVRFIQSKLMSAYERILKLLADSGRLTQSTQYNLNRRVIGYAFRSKSGYDWSYDIHARDLSLIIHAGATEVDEPAILINGIVPFSLWLTNLSDELPDNSRAIIDHCHVIMKNCAKELDAVHVVDITPDTQVMQTVILNELTAIQLKEQVAEFSRDYQQLALVLDNFRIDMTDIPSEIETRTIEKNEVWAIEIDAGDLSLLASVGKDGNHNFYLNEIGESLFEYTGALGHLMKEDTKANAFKLYDRLVTDFNRIVSLKAE